MMELLDFEEPDLFNASVKTGLVDEQLYSASENTELLVESLGGMDLSHHSEEEQGSHSKSPIREIIPPQEIGIGAKPKTSKVYLLIDHESEVDESEALKWHPISCKGQQTSMAVGACSTPYAAVDKKSHKMDYYRKDQHTQTDESCLSGSNSYSDSGGKDRRKVRKNKAQRSKRLSKNCDMDCDKNTAKTSAKPSVTFSSNSYQEGYGSSSSSRSSVVEKAKHSKNSRQCDKKDLGTKPSSQKIRSHGHVSPSSRSSGVVKPRSSNSSQHVDKIDSSVKPSSQKMRSYGQDSSSLRPKGMGKPKQSNSRQDSDKKYYTVKPPQQKVSSPVATTRNSSHSHSQSSSGDMSDSSQTGSSHKRDISSQKHHHKVSSSNTAKKQQTSQSKYKSDLSSSKKSKHRRSRSKDRSQQTPSRSCGSKNLDSHSHRKSYRASSSSSDSDSVSSSKKYSRSKQPRKSVSLTKTDSSTSKSRSKRSRRSRSRSTSSCSSRDSLKSQKLRPRKSKHSRSPSKSCRSTGSRSHRYGTRSGKTSSTSSSSPSKYSSSGSRSSSRSQKHRPRSRSMKSRKSTARSHRNRKSSGSSHSRPSTSGSRSRSRSQKHKSSRSHRHRKPSSSSSDSRKHSMSESRSRSRTRKHRVSRSHRNSRHHHSRYAYSSDDSVNRRYTVKHGDPRKHPKALKYDGKSKFLSFKRKFDSYRNVMEWKDEECKDYLMWSLEGKAIDFFTISTSDKEHYSYRKIMRKLEARFGTQELTETSKAKFRQASQRQDESLDDWADRVMTLATSAFVYLPERHMKQEAITKFCQGCFDKEAARHVSFNNPSTMDAALDQFKQFQFITQAVDNKESRKGREEPSINAVSSSEIEELVRLAMEKLGKNPSNKYPNYSKKTHQGASYKKRQPFQCYFCRKEGHIKKDCQKWKQFLAEKEKESGDLNTKGLDGKATRPGPKK